MTLHKDVWVVAEVEYGVISEVTLELLGEGRRLADNLKQSLCAVLMGQGAVALTQPLVHYGADKVYLVEHPLLVEYTTDAYVEALVALIKERAPAIVILGATLNGRDLAPRVAARLKTGLAANCTTLKFNDQKVLEMTRITHGGKVYTTVTCPTSRPQMATICPGIIGVDKPNTSRLAEVIPVKVTIDSEAVRSKVIRFVKGDPKTVDVSEAEIVVAGGGGVGGLQKWSVIEELADALGGSVAGTRVAIDLGCIPRQRMVGQTGKTTTPKLYLAAGISGASQHVLGMKDAKLIIAINTDRAAPIFKIADMGIVSDLHQVLPAITARLRELTSLAVDEGEKSAHEK